MKKLWIVILIFAAAIGCQEKAASLNQPQPQNDNTPALTKPSNAIVDRVSLISSFPETITVAIKEVHMPSADQRILVVKEDGILNSPKVLDVRSKGLAWYAALDNGVGDVLILTRVDNPSDKDSVDLVVMSDRYWRLSSPRQEY